MQRDVGIRLGQRIRDLREANKLSQAQLATLTCKSVETISNFERGKTVPSVITLTDLAEHLNVGPKAFFEFELPAPQVEPETVIASKAKLLTEEDQQLVTEFIDLLVARRRT